MSTWTPYLEEYREAADAYLKDNVALKFYAFFQDFFQEDNLRKATWSDIQSLGDHIHSFNALALAKKRALGKPNHDIEHYRRVFLYLAHGDDPPEVRIQNFLTNPEYDIKGFGDSVKSEIIGNVFAEQFMFYNRRDKFALELLHIDPGFERGDSFLDQLHKFNLAVQPLFRAYEDVVGRRTDLPLSVEVDQLFSFLYEKHGQTNPYALTEEQIAMLHERFTQQYPGFVDFTTPPDAYLEDERNYKCKALQRFEEMGGAEYLKERLARGEALQAVKETEKVLKINIVDFRAWDQTFGTTEESAALVLDGLLRVAESPYAGAKTYEPLFHAVTEARTKPAWDALSVVLWALRPDEYAPIKIRHYRELAGQLGFKLPSGRPNPKGLHALHEYIWAFRDVLEPWKPRDLIDAQSFLWVVKDAVVDEDESSLEPEETEEPEPPASSGAGSQFWWLNCNPGIWDLNEFPVGGRETWTALNEKGNKRKVYSYFEQVAPDDLVVGYVTAPACEVRAVCKITRGLFDGSDGPEFEFEKTEQLRKGVRFTDLQKHPALKNAEPIQNHMGSLFKLTKQEFDVIREMIAERNPPDQKPTVYTLEEALQELFIEEDPLKAILGQLKYKKNMVLQGPPGVGKTFMAKRLAYLLMGQKDQNRFETVQFHQSYSYEDFIQGFRPNEEGKFDLCNGVFYDFCRAAQGDPGRPYVFMIDEINRGNLSRIFGELMLLLESDKRGKEFAVPLTYSRDRAERFHVPENLYVIGSMNTADRSLAMVDYALRRRFAFVDLKPAFSSAKFAAHLEQCAISAGLVKRIVDRVSELNKEIADDKKDLGRGYQIGHSYFCPRDGITPNDGWYRTVVETEIAPLLREYWFENEEKVEGLVNKLLAE